MNVMFATAHRSALGSRYPLVVKTKSQHSWKMVQYRLTLAGGGFRGLKFSHFPHYFGLSNSLELLNCHGRLRTEFSLRKVSNLRAGRG